MLFLTTIFVAFGCGWLFRSIVIEKRKSKKRERPELLWFNNEKSRWERVTTMQLCVADHPVAIVPVKLIKEK